MDIISIIDKKSKGLSLSQEEINSFVKLVVEEKIEDYQSSALLMAIKINGLTDEELIFYSKALIESGNTLPLRDDIVDKHSTGGVGDKVSILLLPILGAMGIKVFKISGRGLGFTGGTIDKLDGVDGFKTELSLEELNDMVSDIGISITSQTPNLVPADGILYKLRDVTATVDSLPLIAASIISKKIATGAKNILVDLKVGSGAFVSNLEEAQELARLMKLVAKEYERDLFVLFTSMHQPLGYMAGNLIEVNESMDALAEGLWAPDLKEIIKKIATELYAKVKGVTKKEANKKFEDIIKSGEAAKLQKTWFKSHGVTNFVNSTKLKSRNVVSVKADKAGYVTFTDVKEIGFALIDIKAGRKTKDDEIDYHSGVIFKAKMGDFVEKGQELFTVTSVLVEPDKTAERIKACYEIVQAKPKVKHILGEVTW